MNIPPRDWLMFKLPTYTCTTLSIQCPSRLLVLHGTFICQLAYLIVNRYFCPKSKVVHRYDCELCVPADEDASMADRKFRPCRRCPGVPEAGKRPATDDGRAASKKQRAAAQICPAATDADTATERSRYVRYERAVQRLFASSCAHIRPVCPLERFPVNVLSTFH